MKKTIVIAASVAVVALLAVGGFLYFKDRVAPTLALTPDSGVIGKKTQLTLTASDPSGLRNVIVSLRSKSGSVVIASETYAKAPAATITFTLKNAKTRDGELNIVVSAVDGSIFNFGKGNAGEQVFTLTLDTKKPHINTLSGQHNLNRGGAGCIAYSVNEETARTGVRVGERFFPGYKLDNGEFACLFAFPYDMEPAEFQPRLEAEDLAGNIRTQSFPFHINDRTFRKDTIAVPDSFLEAKMPQYEKDYPELTNPLDIYLKVNNEMRTRDRAALLELGQTSESSPLWKGKFLRLPNSANRARFADSRTYLYKGEVVDQQTHLGIDLASLKAAPIPAANAGIVRRTGFHGIYGESIIIDHGLGLMTLYSHLSQIDVDEGDEVTKGQIIGRTGATGLAGGDHLHYGTYISGNAVQPIEWWDDTWIRNNISSRVGQ